MSLKIDYGFGGFQQDRTGRTKDIRRSVKLIGSFQLCNRKNTFLKKTEDGKTVAAEHIDHNW
jgi:hypothetical protein